MPKKISGVREKIIAVAEKLIAEGDYSAFSARQIAARSSVAVGTLYNYFPSMEALTITIIGDEWRETIRKIDERCVDCASVAEGLDIVLRGIRSFTEKYIKFWLSSINMTEQPAIGGTWHGSLREEIAARVNGIFIKFGHRTNEKLLPAIAEIMISLGAGCTIDLEIASELVMTVAKRCCVEN